MRIRETVTADVDAVAALRVAGWQYAYAGLMPQAYLDSLSEREDAARHRERLAARAGSGAPGDLVAVGDDGRVLGWAAFGPYRAAERRTADAELYALYVRPELIGTGVGRELTAATRTEALGRGAPRLFVWVVEGNARARRFYERAGFAADGGRDDFEVGGRRLTDLRYVLDLRR